MSSEFDDIVSDYHGTSDLYAAVVRAEQHHPNALPVIIGVYAWSYLDEDQRRGSIQDAMQGYVESVQAERREGSEEALLDAMEAYNATERTAFRVTIKGLWLGNDGPAYQLGDVRGKALFVDTAGRHWADGALVAESLGHIAGGATLAEAYNQALCAQDEARDLRVWTETRGRWNALMAPVDVIAHAFGYPPPTRLPGDNWARTWWDTPGRTDEEELAWIASGGKPLNTYRGGQS